MDEKKVRFGDYIRFSTVEQSRISYNDLAQKPETDANGKEIPFRAKKLKLKLTGLDVYRILEPYLSIRFMEQLKAVVPLALYLGLFQFFILHQSIENSLLISGGLLGVIVGLMVFMEGLKLGLMPFGETIGNFLPRKSPMWVVLLIAFLLGIGVTFAEPAIGALKEAGSIVQAEKAPILYALLNTYTDTLVLMVGMGVGFAAMLGMLRFIYNWSLKPLIYISLIPCLCITMYIQFFRPELQSMLGLAWDCGAVTTGPVTVPLVLSLGIGVSSAIGKGGSNLSGFGIVTMASLYPIMAVLLLALWVTTQTSPEQIVLAAQSMGSNLGEVAWYEQSPYLELVLAIRAIVPLVIFLMIVMKLVLREKIKDAFIVTYGIVLAVAGMGIFNVGLTYGLSALGGQTGSLVPAAFSELPNIAGSPLYYYGVGISIAFLFAWFLGFGATLAEPALNALGITVENLTNGAFKKSLLLYAVSGGVAFGLGLGVLKIIFDLPLAYMLLGGYSILMIMTFISSEEFVNVAWDSAGVTTGPVTVPLVLAMGLGFGNAVSAVEGFGILSMASVCPIISVLATGLIVQMKEKKSASKKTDVTVVTN